MRGGTIILSKFGSARFNYMNIPEHLKQRREELGLSQYQLAKCIGFKHWSSVYKLEAGIREWRLDRLIEACECLELEIKIEKI